MDKTLPALPKGLSPEIVVLFIGRIGEKLAVSR